MYKKLNIKKKQTAAARKTFEFYEEMHAVVSDRPDIFPPPLIGTDIVI